MNHARPLTFALAALALAAPATGGAAPFTIASCGEAPAGQTGGWTLTPGTSSTDSGTECPPVLDHGGPTNNRSKHTGIYLTDKLGTTDTPAGTEISATFAVAPGTTLTRARVWRFYAQDGEPSWRLRGETLEGQLLDSCTVVENIGCNFGGRSYSNSAPENGGSFVDFDGLSTSGLRYRLTCEAASGSTCVSGSTLYRVNLSLFGLKLTIDDPTAPVLEEPAGPLWTASGYQQGTLSLTAAAQDVTGISETRLLIDEQPMQTIAGACSYTRPVPCTQQPAAALSLNTASLPDGPHNVAIESLDAASNPARRTRTTPLLVDTAAPAAPVALATTSGSTTSTSNAWALRWSLPADTGSPLVRARTTICPAGQSSGCAAPREADSPTSSGAFSLPGPGEWDVRVTLEDELGHTDPANAAAIRLRYEPATTPTPTPPPTTTAPPPSSTPPPPANTPQNNPGVTFGPFPSSTTPAPVPRRSALLRGYRVTRSGSILRVRGKRRSSATGRVTVEVSGRVGKRTIRVKRSVSVKRGRFTVRVRLRGRLAKVRRPRVRLLYAGDERVRPARVTLRAPGAEAGS